MANARTTESQSDLDILARIEQEEAVSYGINDSALSDDRAKAIEYYLGEPFGNEVEGRSQVVSYDVQDTIESALPQILEIFVSGDQVVRFDPKSAADVEASAQETDYINHVVMEKNPGFEIFYVWFKDALLSKNGYIKVWYEEYEEAEEEQYKGLTEAQLMMLTQNPEIEILEQETYPDSNAIALIQQQAQQAAMQGQPFEPPMPPMLYDIKIRVTEKRGCVKIQNVAPENMMVSVDTASTSLHCSRFVQHRETLSRAEIEGMGFEVPENAGFAEDDSFYEESNARDIYNEQYDEAAGVNTADEYLVRDTYMMVEGKRMRYVVIGNQIVHEEEVDCVPFCVITPHLMPHRHIGRSFADLTMDIQLIKSTLIRGQLDNMYLSNNGRYAVSDQVNLEDMLTSRPGGVVRVKGQPAAAIMPLQHAPFPPTSFQLVEYFDTMKEKRTGVTAYNQGLDADSLNKTKGGMQMVMTAAQKRLTLVARLFAETGVKDLFLMVHRLVRQNYTRPDVIQLRGNWVEVDPRTWKTRSDMSIAVGLGTGNKDQQLQHLVTILQAQKEALQIGVASPRNIYNALVKLTQNAGFKNSEEFWTDPQNLPPQEPKEDPLVAVEREKVQGQLALGQQKAQADLQQEQLRSTNDVQIEREKINAQAELERYKAQLKAETDIRIAMIQAELDDKNAQRDMMKSEHEIMTRTLSSDGSEDVQRAQQEVQRRAAPLDRLAEMHQEQMMVNQSVIQALQELAQQINKPKRVVRGPNNEVMGVE